MRNKSAKRSSKPKRDKGFGQRSHPWLRKREGPMRSMGGIAPSGAYCPQDLAPQAQHPHPT